tara:strand:+ start:4079 stop:4477 length:399 start_codon:yes stop_codon:yes gene_type:complete
MTTTFIDRCINTASNREYDYATLIHKLLHKHHVYTEDGWMLKKKMNTPDKKGIMLANDIKTIVVDEFMKRSKYWEKLAEKVTDTNLKNDYLHTSSKIIECANKLLKNERFLNNVIKEAKPMFFIDKEQLLKS